MKFNTKHYKVFKIKHHFKKAKFFIFCHGTNSNISEWLNVEQDLVRSQLSYYRSYNSLTKKSISDSIFKNLTKLANGPLFFVSMYKEKPMNQALTKMIAVNKLLTSMCIRMNNRIYSVPQLINISTLSYITNMIIFRNLLNGILKTPYKIFTTK
uniref:Ribosomal protein L10 n=1 Tax=Minutocellus polymorphus TaxID=265543 RepID=A0A8A6KN90_9STRA|nr:hypothetical protein [Minutocellus polymorphus]